MWKRLALLVLVFICVPQVVLADPPPAYTDITVTAQGYVGEAPGGLTITYITDYEVEIDWIKPSSANNTMIRVKYGNYPEARDDGYLVYYGSGSNFTDSDIVLVGPDIPYYKAWSQSYNGTWEEMGTTAEANFMSISFLFISLLILGLTLFIAAFRWKDMLLSYSAALTWMAIGFWWILGGIDNFGLGSSWVRILVYIPFILSFAVLLRLWNTEIINESKGRKWTEWGSTPREESPNRRDAYRKALRERIGR